MSLKRHLVMDLYHGNQTEPVEGSWNEANKVLPDCKSCKVKVKNADGNELFAYFYQDGAAKFYNPPCKFWDCSSKQPLNNISHWKALRD